MEQFIQYLYEYENGERARNLGFMKVEPKMDKVEINVYSKQLDEVFGIWFRKPDGSCYIAAWENPDECRNYLIQPRASEEQVEVPTEQGTFRVEQAPENFGTMSQSEQEIDPSVGQIPVNFRTSSQTGQSASSKPAQESRTQPEQGASAQPEQDSEDTYIPPSTRTFEKIQRQDLSRLPRKEWRLANNNFLLHGYYNYHHLLYIEDEGKVFIGVPGIFHEREKVAAASFGFPEFIRLTDFEMELSEEEKNTAEDFGYWCRQVEHF